MPDIQTHAGSLAGGSTTPETECLPAQRRSRASVPDRILTLGAMVVIAVGVAMRLWALGARPYGLISDEAFYGLDALRVLGGAHPLYFPANNGREPLFIYLMAATIRLFGRNPLGVRAAGAACGLLTIPATYWLGAVWGNRRTGLLSAALLAGTLWHIHLSRMGLRVVSLPLFIALALSAGGLGLKSRSRALLLAAGVAYGLSFYTYLAARFTPIALLGMLAYGLIWHRDRLRGRWLDGAWILGAALVTALPLGLFAARHPDLVFLRSSEVAIWNGTVHHGDPVGVLAGSAVRVLGMFTWRGDGDYSRNVPHRPVFDPLVSIAFVAGVALTVVGWRRRPAWALSLIWTAVMTLPTILAAEAPHFFRAVGVLPVIMLLPALTLDEGLHRLSRRRRGWDKWTQTGKRLAFWRSSLRRGMPLCVLSLLLGSAALSARDYFGRRPVAAVRLTGFDYAGSFLRDPKCATAFFAPVVDLAQEINRRAFTLYLDSYFYYRFTTVQFLVPYSDRIVFYQPENVLSPGRLPLALVSRPGFVNPRTLRVLPAAAQITVTPGSLVSPDSVRPYPFYVRWTAEPLPGDANEVSAPLVRFASGLRLLSVRTVRSEDDLDIRLSWSRSAPAVAPLAVSVEAIDPAGTPLGRQDDFVGTPYYPPSLWSSRSVVVQHVKLPLRPTGPAPRWLRLRVREAASGRELAIAETRANRQDNALIVPAGVMR